MGASACSSVTYSYLNAEPAYGAANTNGKCYFFTGNMVLNGGGTQTVAAVYRTTVSSSATLFSGTTTTTQVFGRSLA